jgi:hypothetical protein
VRFSNLVIRIRVSGEKLGIYPWFLDSVSLLENSSPFFVAYLRLICIKSPSMHKICILPEANFNSCSHVQPLTVLWDVLVADEDEHVPAVGAAQGGARRLPTLRDAGAELPTHSFYFPVHSKVYYVC